MTANSAGVALLTGRHLENAHPLPAGSVSVVIPARNAGVTIARTLRSIAPDVDLIGEIILVDDGSDDNTVQRAETAANLYNLPLRVLPSGAGSAGAARNRGLDVAIHELIYFVDADDEPMPGCLHRLVSALVTNPSAGLAVGSNIRRTAGRIDKLKSPAGFGNGRMKNAEAYLRNEILPIAMGSALLRRDVVGSARFPEKAGLDEDTIFWAAILAQALPIPVPHPVLLYHHDEGRMKQRFLTDAGAALDNISEALDGLVNFGIGIQALDWRKAWVARRIARELMHAGRFAEAAAFFECAVKDPVFAKSFKGWTYKFRIGLGRLFETAKLQMSGPAPSMKISLNRQNFLLISADCIYPPISGSDQRNWALAKSLSRHGDVTAASLARLPAGISMPDNVNLVSLASDAHVRGKAMRSLRSRIENRITVDSANRLKEVAATLKPELTIISGIPLFGLLEPLSEHGGRVVLDMQNVESELQHQHARSLGPVGGLRLAAEAFRTARLESRASGKVAAITTCSRLDRDIVVNRLRRRVPVHVIPNILPHEGQLMPFKPGASAIILFIGHLGYQPNVDAAVRLATKTMPLITAKIPSARLLVAGRFPRPEVMALARLPGVSVIANPPVVADLYSSASVTVMPITSGGGTRIKILEAMESGVPVVATRKAAEGLDLAEGLDFLAGESDSELADAAIALLERPQLAERIARRAETTAQAYFSSAVMDDAVDAIL